MFGRVLNPLLVAVEQNLLHQNKCVGQNNPKQSFFHILGYFVNTTDNLPHGDITLN